MNADSASSVILAIITSVLASSGLWAYMAKRYAMLVGLAHDRIVSQGMQCIERGFITQDEYENLDVYLFEPYTKLGGNGSAAKIMQEVDKLPIVRPKTVTEA